MTNQPVSENLVEQVAKWLYYWEDDSYKKPPFAIEDWEVGAKELISIIRPAIEKEEKDKWITACAYHGIKIEQPQQLKRIIAQLKKVGE